MTALLSGSVPAEATRPVARARFRFDGLPRASNRRCGVSHSRRRSLLLPGRE